MGDRETQASHPISPTSTEIRDRIYDIYLCFRGSICTCVHFQNVSGHLALRRVCKINSRPVQSTPGRNGGTKTGPLLITFSLKSAARFWRRQNGKAPYLQGCTIFSISTETNICAMCLACLSGDIIAAVITLVLTNTVPIKRKRTSRSNSFSSTSAGTLWPTSRPCFVFASKPFENFVATY